MAKNFTQATAALALLLILIPTTDVAHASCSDNSDCEEKEVEEVIVIGQRLKKNAFVIYTGGNEAPATSNYGQGYGGGSGVPADSSGADVRKVKDCAADGENVFDEAESKGTVRVFHSDEFIVTPTGGNAFGEADWRRGSVHITIYTSAIAEYAEYAASDLDGRRTLFWKEYAITLLHEYRHAVDMFACQCGNPVTPPLSPEGYESTIEQAAQDDYNRLYANNESCLVR